jgi:hypothetical protein
MPRIRTIKPEFPQSESVGRLSREARLLFLLLFTLVDDAGRTRAASRMLASLLYPYDDDAPILIDGWLGELEAADNIRRYRVKGASYLEITNWLIHQKIDKPSKSRLPAFDEASRALANPREASSGDLNPDLNQGPSIWTLTASEKENEAATNGEGVKKKLSKPRHGAVSADKRFVYWKANTEEFLAYMVDYQEVHGAVANHTDDGRWFKFVGEAASRQDRGAKH